MKKIFFQKGKPSSFFRKLDYLKYTILFKDWLYNYLYDLRSLP